MSETNRERRAARAEAGGGAGGPPTFSVVASGENVVLVNTHTGQTWAMATDGARPVWHPVGFEGSADRAPRRRAGKKEATEA